MKIALATCAALPDLDTDDQRLLPALNALDIEVETPVWDDPAVDWSQYAMCVIRSTWDYVPKREAYVAWTKRVSQQTVLWNPAEVIVWNTDKTYLRDLENKGIATVPTQWLTAGSPMDFAACLALSGWDNAVIKPVVSASGKDIFRINRDTIVRHAESLSALLKDRDLMLQPYLKSIECFGELSFLFMNEQFSHAVQKIPAAQDFRVQEHLGGQNLSFAPDASQLAFAEQVIRQIPWPTLYARVDVMQDDQGHLLLSELELTEPSMYLAYDAHSAQRFAQAIRAKCLCLQKGEMNQQ